VRIAITASTGLIGSALAQDLERSGAEVRRLVRHPAAAAGQVQWNPAAPDGGLSGQSLDGLDAVVHLSGAPIAGGRWSAARKQELRASRIGSTTALIRAMLSAGTPPPVLLVASAIGWYGDSGDRVLDESRPNGTGFLAELVRDWEAATAPASAAGLRVVSLRTGIVLSRRGGMLGQLLLPFRLGAGFRIGSGAQYISWITLTDHVRACQFLLAQPRSPASCTGRPCCGYRRLRCAPGSASCPASCWLATGWCPPGCRRPASRSGTPSLATRSRPRWRTRRGTRRGRLR
jgi:uncharacterized protein (TIGR01777 family)